MNEIVESRCNAGKPLQYLRHPAALAAAVLAASLAAAPSFAQGAPVAPTGNAVANLIHLMVQRGLLSQDDADALIAQAQNDALRVQQAEQQAKQAAAVAANVQPGDVRVRYVPETVQAEMTEQVRQQVMAQAKAENWAQPDAIPEWTRRIRIEGDVRLRNESRFFQDGNSNIEIDWAAVNAGSGFDVNPNTNLALPPLRNTRRDRNNVFKVRARLGLIADVNERTQAGVRVATGNDDSPVSTTQTLGGGLSKKDIWLDQAWMTYKPVDSLSVIGGRFANPFWSTDTLFSNDLNLDGIAATFEKSLENKDVSLFGTLGAIPLEYSSDNAPSSSMEKESSHNKWLFGAQVGAYWKLNQDNHLRGAVAYYNFNNISGQLSEPCALYAGADGCSTDWSRPAFMQKGNTLMLLRNIALDPLSPATTPMPQYIGLAAKFRLFDLNLRWDTKIANGLGLRLDANYIRNLAYDEDEMFERSTGGIVNNFDQTDDGINTRSNFKSGPNAYMLQATFGKPTPNARGDWNVLAGYKRIEPDALPDGFNDSSFHLGGTNARGYYLGGSYAIEKNTWFTARWMSTKEVYGPPQSIDLLQLELNTKF